jgi:hypothetical protein
MKGAFGNEGALPLFCTKSSLCSDAAPSA